MEPLYAQLRERLKDRPRQVLALPRELADTPLREAAVLMPLFLREGAPHLLFTQRPLTLRNHAGQISFPGGGRDEADETPLHTALRETEEELGLAASGIQVLGELDELATITRFRIRPFVAALAVPFVLRPSPVEIEAVLEVPLAALLDPSKQRVETHQVLGAKRDIYFYDWGPHVIWGATARIVRNFFAVAGDLPAIARLRT